MATLQFKDPARLSSHSTLFFNDLELAGWPIVRVNQLRDQAVVFEALALRGTFEEALQMFHHPVLEDALVPHLQAIYSAVRLIHRAERNIALSALVKSLSRDAIAADEVLSGLRADTDGPVVPPSITIVYPEGAPAKASAA